MTEPRLARQHNPVQPVRMLQERFQHGPGHNEVQVMEVLGLGVHCLRQVEDADIAWPHPYGPTFNLSGITALGVKLDEIVIDPAAGDGEWRAAKLLSDCRHAPQNEGPEMVTIDLDREGVDSTRIGKRHIEQRRGYAAPCP